MGAMLGLHYVRSLFTGLNVHVCDEFKEKKYGFYQFQRKLPNTKSEAYKYQFKVGVMLLAATGQYKVLQTILSLVEATEVVYFENIIADEGNNKTAAETSKV